MIRMPLLIGALLMTELASAAAVWTAAAYDPADYVRNECILGGCTKGVDARFDGLIDTAMQVMRGMTNVWTFTVAKDVECIAYYSKHTDSGRSNFGIESVEVIYEGESEYVLVTDSSLPTTKSSSPTVKAVFADPAGGLALENVRGIRVITTTDPANEPVMAELEVIGRSRGNLSWKTGVYTDEAYVQAENRLIEGGSATLNDGKTSTWGSVSNNGELSWSFSSAKDISAINLYSAWGDHGRVGFEIASILVKHPSDTEYSEVPGSGNEFFCFEATRNCAFLAPDTGCIAANVVALKIRFGRCQNGQIGVGEAEVVGVDRTTETLVAANRVTGGVMTSQLSGSVTDLPVDVCFCCGDEDGGDDPAAWDSTMVVGSITAGSPTVEYERAADFAYGRFYYLSRRYGECVWSETIEISERPSGAVSVVSTAAEEAEFELALVAPGGSYSTADILFAYALQGMELPPVAPVASGIEAGGAVTNRITGLSIGLTYDYRCVFRNPGGEEQVVEGSFSTIDPGYWTRDRFVDQPYIRPWYWLSGGHADSTYYGTTNVVNSGLRSNDKYTWTFAETKDIMSVGVYSKWVDTGRVTFEVLSIDVKYSADGEFVTLHGSYLPQVSLGGTGQVAKFLPVQGFVAKGVYELRICFGTVQAGAIGCAALEVTGVSSEGPGTWTVDSYAAEDYVRPADVLEGGTGDTLLYDGLVDGTKTVWGNQQNVFTWEFPHPRNLRVLRVLARGFLQAEGDVVRKGEFGIESVAVKYKGDDDFTVLPGSSLDYFGLGKARTVAVYGAKDGRCFARNVVALRFKVNRATYDGATFAELEVCGRDTRGIKLIIR